MGFCTVLGLGGQAGARRLVRILLADPLAPKQPWEKQLDTIGEDDGRGLLIRYIQEKSRSNMAPGLIKYFISDTAKN